MFLLLGECIYSLRTLTRVMHMIDYMDMLINVFNIARASVTNIVEDNYTEGHERQHFNAV